MFEKIKKWLELKKVERATRELRKLIEAMKGFKEADFQLIKVYETAIAMGELRIAALKEGKASQTAKEARENFYKAIERLRNDSILTQDVWLEENVNLMLEGAQEFGVLEE